MGLLEIDSPSAALVSFSLAAKKCQRLTC